MNMVAIYLALNKAKLLLSPILERANNTKLSKTSQLKIINQNKVKLEE